MAPVDLSSGEIEMKQIALVLGFVLAISSAAMAEPLDIDKLTDDQLKALKEDQLLTLPAIRLMERLAAIDPKTPKEGDEIGRAHV